MTWIDSRDTLAELLDFCIFHRIPMDPSFSFIGRAPEKRLCLWGVPGSGVEVLLQEMCGVRLSSQDLRGEVVEIQPGIDGGYLREDGTWECNERPPNSVRWINGRTFANHIVSAILDGVPAARALDPNIWLNRVTAAVVLTPASAALGNSEVSLLRRLATVACPYFLLVTGLNGLDDSDREAFCQEIEKFKVGPLRRELGLAEVLYVGELRNDQKLLQTLAGWIEVRSDLALKRLLSRAAGLLFENAENILLGRITAGERLSSRVARIREHAEDQIRRLEDHVSLEVQRLKSGILLVANEGRDLPFPAWCQAVDSALQGLEYLGDVIYRTYRSEVTEFCRAYGDFLAPMESSNEGEAVSASARPTLWPMTVEQEIEVRIEPATIQRSWWQRRTSQTLLAARQLALKEVVDARLDYWTRVILPEIEQYARDSRENFRSYVLAATTSERSQGLEAHKKLVELKAAFNSY